jgi:hypothetical protein
MASRLDTALWTQAGKYLDMGPGSSLKSFITSEEAEMPNSEWPRSGDSWIFHGYILASVDSPTVPLTEEPCNLPRQSVTGPRSVRENCGLRH